MDSDEYNDELNSDEDDNDYYCTCGEPATVFMDSDGDPLDTPMCFDCFFFHETTDWR